MVSYSVLGSIGLRAESPKSGRNPEVSFRPPGGGGVDTESGYAYTVLVAADALLAELERPPADPWRRPAPLPQARADRPEAPGPLKLNYTHEDCIDAILANPTVTQNALAQRYGYTPAWISLIINSDAFQAALAKRRDEVISPELRATVEERFRALITESQRVLHTKLMEPNCPPNLALGVLGTASKALGYGARDQTVHLNQTFVVALPAAAASSEEWARGRTIEHSPATGRAPSADSTPTGGGDSASSPAAVGGRAQDPSPTDGGSNAV